MNSPMPDFRIAEAGPKDSGRIVQLAWEIWPEWYHRVIGPEQVAFMLDQLYRAEVIETRMEKGLRYFILQTSGLDAGFFAVNCSVLPFCRLENLYLKEQVRGMGFGNRMMERAVEIAQESGKSRIQCNVNRFNPAYAYYLRQGFHTVEIADIPFGPFFLNDYILEKQLS
jgi:ribosomal protein S18 acetylase RimI-like enzyme